MKATQWGWLVLLTMTAACGVDKDERDYARQKSDEDRAALEAVTGTYGSVAQTNPTVGDPLANVLLELATEVRTLPSRDPGLPLQRSILVARLSFAGGAQTTITFTDVAFDPETRALNAAEGDFIFQGKLTSESTFLGSIGVRGYNDYRLPLTLSNLRGGTQTRVPVTTPVFRSLRLEGQGQWKGLGTYSNVLLDLPIFGTSGANRLRAYLSPSKIVDARLVMRVGSTDIEFKNSEWNQAQQRLVGTSVIGTRTFTLDCMEDRSGLSGAIAAMEAGPMKCVVMDSSLGEVAQFEFPNGGKPQ